MNAHEFREAKNLLAWEKELLSKEEKCGGGAKTIPSKRKGLSRVTETDRSCPG